MTFLPIVERELRVASRHGGTYWVRLGAALVALLIGGWIMLLFEGRQPRGMGTAMFVTLSIFTYVYCLLAGLRTTADSLSEEKREGTLGLLFLTDLKGYDVVLGKLVATSLNAFYGILAVFPVMALPLLLGGVTVTEFWRVVLSSLNVLFFSLSVGMFVSSISRDERKSMSATFGIIFFFAAGMPLLGAITLIWAERGEVIAPFWNICSPGFSCFLAFDQIYQEFDRMGYNYYVHSAVTVHLMSWLLLLSSCYIVPRSWQDRPESRTQMARRQRWREIKHGTSTPRMAWRQSMLAINPVYWLTSRDWTKSMWVWVVLALGGLVWCWGLIKYPHDWTNEAAYMITALTAHTIMKLWILSEACRQFAHDRRSGALELLLSTPLTIREILGGQLASLRRQFLGPVLLILVVDVIFLLAEADEEWVTLFLAGIGIFVVDLITLSWLGMWFGLSMGNPGRASSAGVSIVMVLPWVVWALTMTVVEVSDLFRPLVRSFSISGFYLSLFLWVGIGLVIDAYFGFRARRMLLSRFRSMAATRPSRRAVKTDATTTTKSSPVTASN